MDMETEARRYAETPTLLIDLCRKVLELLDTGTGDETTKQLQAVSAFIAQLERQKIAVTDALRAEKLRLAEAQADGEQAAETLREVVDGLEQLIRPYLSKNRGQHNALSAPKVRRRTRRTAETTDRETLRNLIITILRSYGGRAQVSDVLDEMEEQLQGNFLPRDHEVLSKGEPVWRNNVRWERAHMVKDGILRNDSRHGVWELSDQYK